MTAQAAGSASGPRASVSCTVTESPCSSLHLNRALAQSLPYAAHRLVLIPFVFKETLHWQKSLQRFGLSEAHL